MEISFRQIVATVFGGGMATFWLWTCYLVYEQGGLSSKAIDMKWFELPMGLLSLSYGVIVAAGLIQVLAKVWERNPKIRLRRPTRKRDKIPKARVV